MGNVLKSRLHFEGAVYEGEALLETAELLFRGERRLTIRFDEIRSVDASDGRLHLELGKGHAALELGVQAAKWAEKIRNPKSVIQKLGVKPGQEVSVIGLADEAFVEQLAQAGAQVSRGRAKQGSAAIFYGAATRTELARLEELRGSLAPDGALWVVRPRGVKEITEGDTMAAGKAAGLVDVKVVRFSETHIAEKFVVPLAKRKP